MWNVVGLIRSEERQRKKRPINRIEPVLPVKDKRDELEPTQENESVKEERRKKGRILDRKEQKTQEPELFTSNEVLYTAKKQRKLGKREHELRSAAEPSRPIRSAEPIRKPAGVPHTPKSQRQQPVSSRRSEKQPSDPSSIREIDYSQIDADRMLNYYGYGVYQMFGYFLCQMLNFIYSASFFVVSFTLIEPKMNCETRNGTVAMDNRCRSSEGGSCASGKLLVEETIPVTSQIREYGIHCDHAFVKEAGKTLFTVGAMAAVPVMCVWADRYGRRPMLLINTGIGVGLSLLMPWISVTHWVFLIIRLLLGAACDSLLSIGSILTYELVSNRSRAWITLVRTIAWSLGMAWVGVLAYCIRDWRWFQLAAALPGLLTLSYYWFLPESPHWLVQKNRVEQIKKYIATSDRWNRKTLPVTSCLTYERRLPASDPETPSILAMLKCRPLCKLLVINGLIQFTLSFVYFAVSLDSVDAETGQLAPFFLAAMIDIPGAIVVIPLMQYFGRRPLTLCSLVATGACAVVAAILKANSPGYVASMLLAKTFINVCQSVHPIYTSEMLPTCVRSLAFALINVPQSVGILVAPFFQHIRGVFPGFPHVLVALLSAVSAVGCFFMPETRDRPMPQTLADLYKDKSEFSVISSRRSEISIVEKKDSKKTIQ